MAADHIITSESRIVCQARCNTARSLTQVLYAGLLPVARAQLMVHAGEVKERRWALCLASGVLHAFAQHVTCSAYLNSPQLALASIIIGLLARSGMLSLRGDAAVMDAGCWVVTQACQLLACLWSVSAVGSLERCSSLPAQHVCALLQAVLSCMTPDHQRGLPPPPMHSGWAH